MLRLGHKIINSLSNCQKMNRHVLSGESVHPQIPKREAIPMSEERVQEYNHLTASEYRMIFEGQEEKK